MTSAYPATLETLIPQAQQLVADLGAVPSRNKLMTEFRIGARKAARLRDALTEQPGPAVDPAVAADPARRLHALPATDTAPMANTGSGDSPTSELRHRAGDGTDQAGSVTTASRPDASHQAPSGASRAAGPDASRVDARRGWRRPASWPLILLALPAFVAIWSGWVGLGELCGYGVFHPLPGIADRFAINTAITLPIGVETYAAYALRTWLTGSPAGRARWFGKYSALGSLTLGALGQIAYHLMSAAHLRTAPWPITTAVACLPVVVLGFAAALDHLQRHPDPDPVRAASTVADAAPAGLEVSR